MEKIYFGSNLSQLRKDFKMTQDELATLANTDRTTISNYERNRTLPGLDIVEKMSKIFHIKPSVLIYRDISEKLEMHYLLPSFHTAAPNRHLEMLTESQNHLHLFVPVKASAGYLNGEYVLEPIDEYKQVILPWFHEETRSFEVSGDSMEPIMYDGDIVTGVKCYSLTEITHDGIYVVVSKNVGITIKRMELNQKDKTVILKSQNPNYANMEIDADQVKEIWIVRAKSTRDLTLKADQARIKELENKMQFLFEKLNIKP